MAFSGDFETSDLLMFVCTDALNYDCRVLKKYNNTIRHV